jgi:hypothetical protein
VSLAGPSSVKNESRALSSLGHLSAPNGTVCTFDSIFAYVERRTKFFARATRAKESSFPPSQQNLTTMASKAGKKGTPEEEDDSDIEVEGE